MKKSRFSTNITLYLGNDARESSYYGRRIGNRIQAKWLWTQISRSRYYSTSDNSKTFEWYHFQWLERLQWRSEILRRCNAWLLCDSWASCNKKTVRKKLSSRYCIAWRWLWFSSLSSFYIVSGKQGPTVYLRIRRNITLTKSDNIKFVYSCNFLHGISWR